MMFETFLTESHSKTAETTNGNVAHLWVIRVGNGQKGKCSTAMTVERFRS